MHSPIARLSRIESLLPLLPDIRRDRYTGTPIAALKDPIAQGLYKDIKVYICQCRCALLAQHSSSQERWKRVLGTYAKLLLMIIEEIWREILSLMDPVFYDLIRPYIATSWY